MTSYDDLMRENETLRRRVSLLRAASLRSGAGLELDTVLREVVESARALTGARYGGVITLDRSGQARDFVSSGLSDEEHRRLAQWPDGPRLFVHVLPGIVAGQEDVPLCLRPNGFCTDLLNFQDTPIRHQGVHVGNLFLVEKEDGKEFTREDDQMMASFASQVAGAIANARTYRAEHRARTDLEALVDNSPVGVAVFDAVTGSLASLNRGAKRLLESLHLPGSRAGSGPFTLGELTIDYDRRSAALAGRPLALTATEYELLRVLALNAGKVSTYDTLLRRVWGRRGRGDLKLVRAYVGKLRRKLGDDANRPTYIVTERSQGYRMNRPGTDLNPSPPSSSV